MTWRGGSRHQYEGGEGGMWEGKEPPHLSLSRPLESAELTPEARLLYCLQAAAGSASWRPPCSAGHPQWGPGR